MLINTGERKKKWRRIYLICKHTHTHTQNTNLFKNSCIHIFLRFAYQIINSIFENIRRILYVFFCCSDELCIHSPHFVRMTNSRKKNEETINFYSASRRGATSAAKHRGRFLSTLLAASTLYGEVEEGGKFQKQHPQFGPREIFSMKCAHA